MITLEKLRIFERYNGDADGFVRTGTKTEKECLDNNDWIFIDNVIQNLNMIKNGVCSNDFKNRTFLDLDSQFEFGAKTMLLKRFYLAKSDNGQ